MSVLDLLLSRQALAAGVGMTTRRNKVLPGAIDDQAIGERTGIGKPKFDTPATEIIEDRTFVFSVFNGTVATIANRIAGSTGLRVVRTGMAVAAATYCIGALKTFVSKWRDCWRIDANTFGINGNVPPYTVGVGVVPTHERSSLPYVANDGSYYPTCIGDATRSTLFIGKVQEGLSPRVLSISTTGTQTSQLIAANCFSSNATGAGARIDSAGRFRFYGMSISQVNNALLYLSPGWSIMAATRAAPYIQETAYGAALTQQLRGSPYVAAYNGINYAGTNAHASAPYSYSPTLCPFYLGSSVTNRSYPSPNPQYEMTWDEIRDVLYYLTPTDYSGRTGTQTTTTINNVVNASVPAYSYIGSDIQLGYAATLETTYSSSRKIVTCYFPYVSGGIGQQFSGGAQNIVSADSDIITTLTLTSAIAAIGNLSHIRCAISGDYAYTDDYVPTVVSIQSYGYTSTESEVFYTATALADAIAAQNAPGYKKVTNPATLSAHSVTRSSQRVSSLLAQTRDFIIADIDEGIYLYLKAELTLERTETYNFTTLGWTPTNTYNLTLAYVLSIRGVDVEFPVYSGNGFTAPVIDMATIFTGDSGYLATENFHGNYHPGYKPIAIFAPLFMAQGNCPYMAYTTQAEEAAGATAEFYLDISIKVLQYTTFTGTRYDGIVPVVPHQFLAMFRRYIGGETKDAYPSYPLTQNTTLWASLFPTATPFRIQFANGVAGAWNTALGAPFTSNPTTEITRI